MNALKPFCAFVVFFIATTGCLRNRESSPKALSEEPDSLIRVEIYYDGDICPWTTDRLVSGDVSDYVCNGKWVTYVDEAGNESMRFEESKASLISIQDKLNLLEFQMSLEKMAPMSQTQRKIDCWFGVLLFYPKRIDTLAVGIYPENPLTLNGINYNNPKILRIVTRIISEHDFAWTSIIERACSDDILKMVLGD